MKVVDSLLELIGETPIIKMNKLSADLDSLIIGKIESYNPTGSVKDRIALAMIEDAEKKGLINEDTVLVEPTSGNTGIGLSLIASLKGYRLIVVMPESMSLERRQLIKAYGAEILLTPKELDVHGAVEKAKSLVEENEGWLLLDQFSNKANPIAHYQKTAKEIYEQIGQIDIMIAGVGTGGTLSGVGKYFKEKNPEMKIYALDPKSGYGDQCLHGIQGIGDGFSPDNLDASLIDKYIEVTDTDAFKGMRLLLEKEGVLAGISTGASVFVARKVAQDEIGKKILIFIADRGERYLSLNIFAGG